jgi:adenosylhomocysteine nucleosidase
MQGITAGVVVAMAAEGRHLIAHGTGIETLSTEIFPTYRLTIAGTPCVMIRSGIGMVHAAAAAQALIARHQPDVVLNFGCTGAHRADIGLGDVVIGDRCVHHAAVQILPDGFERYVGFTSEEGSDIAHVSRFDAVTADPALVDLAVNVVLRDGIERWPGNPVPPRWHVGAIASADVWTQQTSRLEALHRKHGTLCEDMEAAAIGRIAHLYRLPFLSVKDISNNEFLKSTDLTDFTQFPIGEVGKRAAAVLAGLIGDLGQRGSGDRYSRYSSGRTVIAP